MKNTINTIIVSFLCICAIPSCVSGGGGDGVVKASPRVNKGSATTFKRGDFVPDRHPLKPADTRDLRELAMTLPIWESDSDEMTKWIYENSSAAIQADMWTTPADGAQSAVRLKRLANSPDGAQRIELWIPPSKLYRYPRDMSWSSVLRRLDGGWLVESARTITA